MGNKPRTGRLLIEDERGPVFETKGIELEPVLDLLEEAFSFLGWNKAEQELEERLEVFLHEHGRLK